MNNDEFAFFNQQLSAMLRDGIPLEGALRRLTSEMREGPLRREINALGDDLARGTPLDDALQSRQLPDLYRRLIRVGVKSNDLPGTLTLLADHYHRQHQLWTRLRGLMVYPVIVLAAVFLVSCLFVFIQNRIGGSVDLLFVGLEGRPLPRLTALSVPLMENMWVFPAFFGLVLAAVLAALYVPALREKLQRRVPAFYEAGLSRIASGLHLLLRSGTPLPEAVAVMRDLEGRRATASDLGRWLEKLRQGAGGFSEFASQSRAFPPLFVWMVANSGQDLADGFSRAAALYQSRAEHRAETALYAALPLAVLFLGLIILSEAYLMLGSFLVIIDMLNSLGG